MAATGAVAEPAVTTTKVSVAVAAGSASATAAAPDEPAAENLQETKEDGGAPQRARSAGWQAARGQPGLVLHNSEAQRLCC